MIEFKCNECGKQLRVKDDAAGKKGKCRQCGTVLLVPAESESLLQPPAGRPNDVVGDVEERTAPPTTDSAERYGFPNYGKYAQYTKTRDWKALCGINGVELYSFGTKKELKVLPNYLEDDEVVFALTSGLMEQTHTSNKSDSGVNTWLVVLTSERFLFLDHALFTKSVDTQSIRHDRVQAVSASQGWLLGKITVDIGARTVVIDNCHKATVQPIASLANKWLAALQKKKEAAAAGGGSSSASPLDEIKKLADLHSAGVLTDDEFASAKAKLLASM